MELRAPEPLGGRRGHRGGAAGSERRWVRVKGEGGRRAPENATRSRERSPKIYRMGVSWLSLSPGVPESNRTKPRGFSQQGLCDLGAECHFPVSISPFNVGTMLIPLPGKKKKVELNHLEGARVLGGKRGGGGCWRQQRQLSQGTPARFRAEHARLARPGECWCCGAVAQCV